MIESAKGIIDSASEATKQNGWPVVVSLVLISALLIFAYVTYQSQTAVTRTLVEQLSEERAYIRGNLQTTIDNSSAADRDLADALRELKEEIRQIKQQ